MYAAYKYLGGASHKNIFSDLKAIVTGTTDKNLLSSDCDKAGTSITATVASGWSTTTGGMALPDDRALPANGQLLCCPVSNGSYLLWPIFGTNKILKSTNNGDSWTSFTLPVSLGTSAFTYGWPKPLAWNGTVWVLCDPTQSVNYVLTSTDGETFVQRTIGGSQQWKDPVWGGSVWLLTALNSTQATATADVNGASWTYRATALPSAQAWGIPVYDSGLWVITPNNYASANTQSTAFATSTDGLTFTARTLPATYYSWTPKKLNGVWVIAGNPTAGLANLMTATDGLTFTSRALPAASQWDVQFNDSMFVASTFGTASTGYVCVSNDAQSWTQTLSGAGVRRALFVASTGMWYAGGVGSTVWTSTDCSSWAARAITSLFGSANYGEIIELAGILYVFGATATNGYLVSYDSGATWTTKQNTLSGIFSNITISKDSLNVVAGMLYFNSASVSPMAAVMSYNGGGSAQCIRALNADATTYKKVLLSVADKCVMLFSAEDIGINTVLNKINNSDVVNLAQPLDLSNGGILFIQATKEYIWLLSYRPSSTAWGATANNGGTAIGEYGRDDEWSAAQGYPTHCWLNSASFDTGNYSPRLKSNASLDVTGSAAFLNAFIVNPFPKQAMNASGLAVPPAINARVCNFSSLLQGVVGGSLLGGIKQTVASYGSSGDQMPIGSTNYMVYGGSTFRLLVPLQ